jgi:hypothetical protein
VARWSPSQESAGCTRTQQPGTTAHLGKRVGKELVYMGRSDGLVPHHRKPNPKTAHTLVSPKSKLTKHMRKSKATWVDPHRGH